jgi:hypothetical protein
MCTRGGYYLKKWSLIWVIAAALVFPSGRDLPALTSNPREYQLKAGFLYNFAHFIEWPANAFPGPDSPIVIGVLGSDPFASDLDAIAQGEKVNNHPLVVQRYQQVDEVKACHILFVSQSEAKRLDRIFMSLKNRSVLTVGDTDDFARRGGVIRFVTKNNKIRFTINLEAARAANLTISSKLLRVAETAAPGGD